MKPTTNKLLVRVIEPAKSEGEEKKKGNEVMSAEVLKVGPTVSGAIQVGDRIVFSPFGFDEVSVPVSPGSTEFEKLVIISEEMILATYE